MRKRIEEKNSQLCIGIDPPVELSNEQKLNFALQIISKTSKFASAYKPNRQYFLGFPVEWMQEITREIKRQNAASIIDHKLSDIGSTNLAAIRHIAEEGYDYFTFSPFAGNLKETSIDAHDHGVKIISLTLMSNPEAVWMTEGAYIRFAEQAEKYADGMVIGSTNHITKEHLLIIRERAPSPFVLAPGVGFQGGSPDLILDVFGKDAIFNSSRSILQAEDPMQAAKDLRDLIRSYWQ